MDKARRNYFFILVLLIFTLFIAIALFVLLKHDDYLFKSLNIANDELKKENISLINRLNAFQHGDWIKIGKTQILFEEFLKSEQINDGIFKRNRMKDSLKDREFQIAVYQNYLITRRFKKYYFSLTDAEKELFVNAARMYMSSHCASSLRDFRSIQDFDEHFKYLYQENDWISSYSIYYEKGTMERLEKEINDHINSLFAKLDKMNKN